MKIDPRFNSPSEIFNTLAVIIFTIVTMLFPLWVRYATVKNFEKLGSDEIADKYGPFYEDLNLDNKITALYIFFFIVRRLLISAILIFLRNFCFL